MSFLRWPPSLKSLARMAKGTHAQHSRMTIDYPAIRMKGPREIIFLGLLSFAFRASCSGIESVLK